MEKLALLGGAPVRSTPLHYGRQYIDDDDVRAVEEVLRSDFLTCGPKIPQLEQKLREVTGAAYAVALANGTAALHAACAAAGIGPGDEVITTPMTFAASANCALYCGATPVFADIHPGTWNIDPVAVERCITPRTKAVVAVDYTGQAAALNELMALCKKHGLVLIEDAAHSIGTRYDGRPVGAVAHMTTFSFHPVKTVTAGEGGAVTTNDEELYRRLVLFRTHGITREPAQLLREDAPPWWYEQLELGYNYRLTDIQAALLLSQLDKLPRFARRRREIVQRYDEAFAEMDSVQLQQRDPLSDTVAHLYVLRLRPNKLTVGCREVYQALAAENIVCNVHYIPVYWHPYYEAMGYTRGLCPEAEAHYQSILSLPLYYALEDGDVDDVICAVKKVLGHYAKQGE